MRSKSANQPTRRFLPPTARSASRAGYATTDFRPTGAYSSPRADFSFWLKKNCVIGANFSQYTIGISEIEF